MTDNLARLGIEIEITPAPTDAERAAILAALKTILTRRGEEGGRPLPAWAAAGRREAVSGRVEQVPERWRTANERATPR